MLGSRDGMMEEREEGFAGMGVERRGEQKRRCYVQEGGGINT